MNNNDQQNENQAKEVNKSQSILDNATITNSDIGEIKQTQNNINQSHVGSGDNVARDKIINNYNYLNQTNDVQKLKQKDIIYENLGRRGISREQFKGREKDLDKLHELLQNNGQVAITAAVTGMGGVGKTELAIQYARKYLNLKTYQGGVGWFTARNFPSELLSFDSSQFNDISISERVDLVARIQACYRQWVEGEVLFVIDDVTEYKTEIEPYLPENPRFKVLLTSRLRFQNPIVLLDLEILELDSALELLEFWVGKEKIQADLENAQKICEWLGYLPLALELLGRYIKDEDLSLEEMLGELQEIRLQHPALDQGDYSPITAQLGVRDTLNLSWQRLDNKAQFLACVFSIFALTKIEWELVIKFYQSWLGEAFNKIELRESRKELLTKHLLKGKEKYNLHQLVREFLQDKLENLEEKEEVKWVFVKLIIAEAREIPETLTLNIFNQVNSTILHIYETQKIINILFLKNKNKNIANLSKNQEKDLGITIEDLSILFMNLGRFHCYQADYETAIKIAKQHLSICIQYLGEQHPHLSSIHNHIGLIYYHQGDYIKAKLELNHALAIREKFLEKDSPDLADSLDNLAMLYCKEKDFSQAKDLLNQSLNIRRRRKKYDDLVISLNNLAGIYCEWATDIEKKYNEVQETRFFINFRRYLREKNEYYHQAKLLFEEALEVGTKIFNYKHPDIASILNNLAGIYRQLGNDNQAEGNYFQARKNYDQAEYFYLEALKIQVELLGKEHRDVAVIISNMGVLYAFQEYFQEAKLLTQQALKIFEQSLGVNHIHTINIQQSLNNICQETSYKKLPKNKLAEICQLIDMEFE